MSNRINSSTGPAASLNSKNNKAQSQGIFFNETEDEIDDSKAMTDGQERETNKLHNLQKKQSRQSLSFVPFSSPIQISMRSQLLDPLRRSNLYSLAPAVRGQEQNQAMSQSSFRSSQDSSQNGQSQCSGDPLNVDYAMMFLLTVIQNNIQIYVQQQGVLQSNILEDIGRLRFILISYHTHAMHKCIYDEEFDLDAYEEFIQQPQKLDQFIYLEYPYLAFDDDQQEEVVRYENMTEDEFEIEFYELHSTQSINSMIEMDKMEQMLRFYDDDDLNGDLFKRMGRTVSRQRWLEEGPLDSVLSGEDLFSDIGKFSKPIYKSQHLLHLSSSPDQKVSIRRQNPSLPGLQNSHKPISNPSYIKNSIFPNTSSDLNIKTDKSQLNILPSISIAGKSNYSMSQQHSQSLPPSQNKTSVSYEQFVTRLDNEKKKQQQQKMNRASSVKIETKSQFQLILANKQTVGHQSQHKIQLQNNSSIQHSSIGSSKQTQNVQGMPDVSQMAQLRQNVPNVKSGNSSQIVSNLQKENYVNPCLLTSVKKNSLMNSQARPFLSKPLQTLQVRDKYESMSGRESQQYETANDNRNINESSIKLGYMSNDYKSNQVKNINMNVSNDKTQKNHSNTLHNGRGSGQGNSLVGDANTINNHLASNNYLTVTNYPKPLSSANDLQGQNRNNCLQTNNSLSNKANQSRGLKPSSPLNKNPQNTPQQTTSSMNQNPIQIFQHTATLNQKIVNTNQQATNQSSYNLPSFGILNPPNNIPLTSSSLKHSGTGYTGKIETNNLPVLNNPFSSNKNNTYPNGTSSIKNSSDQSNDQKYQNETKTQARLNPQLYSQLNSQINYLSNPSLNQQMDSQFNSPSKSNHFVSTPMVANLKTPSTLNSIGITTNVQSMGLIATDTGLYNPIISALVPQNVNSVEKMSGPPNIGASMNAVISASMGATYPNAHFTNAKPPFLSYSNSRFNGQTNKKYVQTNISAMQPQQVPLPQTQHDKQKQPQKSDNQKNLLFGQKNQPSQIKDPLVSQKNEQKSHKPKIFPQSLQTPEISQMSLKDFMQKYFYEQFKYLYQDLLQEIQLSKKWSLFDLSKQRFNSPQTITSGITHQNNQSINTRPSGMTALSILKDKQIIKSPLILTSCLSETLRASLQCSMNCSAAQSFGQKSQLIINQLIIIQSFQRGISQKLSDLEKQLGIDNDMTRDTAHDHLKQDYKYTAQPHSKLQFEEQQHKQYLTDNEELTDAHRSIVQLELWLKHNDFCRGDSNDEGLNQDNTNDKDNKVEQNSDFVKINTVFRCLNNLQSIVDTLNERLLQLEKTKQPSPLLEFN